MGCRSRTSNNCQRVQTQENFAQSTFFIGRWYSQSQKVLDFQPADSFNCVTANYLPKNSGTILGWTLTVVNTLVKDNGKFEEAELCGRDRPNDGDAAKLTVAPCFLPTFLGGDYWVLAYDADQGYTLIVGGQPDVETDQGCYPGGGTNGLWILTRDAIPAPGLVDMVKGLAIEQGIDVSVMLDVNHTGCEYPPELTTESEATMVV